MPPPIKKLKIDNTIADLLNKTLKLEGFFPELTEEHVEKIFLRSGLYFYPTGSSIVEQESPGRDIYVVQQGNLGVFRKDATGTHCIATLKDGDIFGEIGLIDGVRIATVTAQEDSKVFHLAYTDIQYLLQHNKDLGAHLNNLAKERLKPDSPSSKPKN